MTRQFKPIWAPKDIAAASAPPRGIDAIIRVTTLMRRSADVDSEESAMKFGMAPPTPNPVRNLMVRSVFGPVASAENASNQEVPDRVGCGRRHAELHSAYLR